MNSSMADYLKVVTPHLHHELVSPEVMSNLQALGKILPPFSTTMLEFRLDTDQSQVDLSVFQARHMLHLSQELLAHPAWQAFQSFCQEWVEPTSFLYRTLKYTGLEFDLDEQRSQLPIPCIFVSWDQGSISDDLVLKEIAPRLPNNPVSSKLKSNLQLCVDSLPDSARIESIGVMLSRPEQAVRVIMTGIPLQQVSDYLVKIGWREPTNTFSNLVSTLSDFRDEIRLLSFDVGDTIYPRIGLEFFPKKQPHHEPQWQLFFNYLVETGLCSQAKKNALLAWPGLSQKADNPELWTENLTGCDRLLSSRASSVFWRTINHIKIVYQPGIPLQAKGYVMFGHHWFPASTLATSS